LHNLDLFNLLYYVSQVTSLRAFIELDDAFAKISSKVLHVNIHCMSTLQVALSSDLHARLLLVFLLSLMRLALIFVCNIAAYSIAILEQFILSEIPVET